MAIDKQQVIDTYIDKNNNKSVLGFLGINRMLGIDKAIKQYLNAETKPDIKSTENIGDFLKGSILINFFLKDKKNELDKLKEYLEINKDNQMELENLSNEIKKGTEIEKALITTKEKTYETNNTNIPTDIKAIRNAVEIKGDFANIKEVKDTDGKVILECISTIETPYIHIDVLDDLLSFAKEFFENTGKSLTLNSAYRTISHQEKLKKEKGAQAAKAGESGHNLGLSIDIEGGDRYDQKIGGINGIREIAKKHNFYPLSGENRHFDHKTLPNAGERLALAQSLDKNFQENIA